MSICLKSPREIELMKKAGDVIKGLFKVLKSHTVAGVSTLDLDKIARSYITMNGGIPSSKGYEGYPGNICISVNDVLIHGIPSAKTILKEGDIVSYDVVVTKNGYMADATRTYAVGKISQEAKNLVQTAIDCFFAGVKTIHVGSHIGDISAAIYELATSRGYTLTRMFAGHGIGSEMHEDPDVPNVGKAGTGPKIYPGLAIAIEPMINEGKVDLIIDKDGWTTRTKDGKLCAHYENTVIVNENDVEIITLDEGEENF